MGTELAFSNYRLSYARQPKAIDLGGDFYDRSLALGFFGRAYTKPATFRLFVQATVFGDCFWVRQPVFIDHAYGTHQYVINHREVLINGALALGFSIGDEYLRLEPYIQLGFSAMPDEYWGNEAILASMGKLQEGYLPAVFIGLLNFKYTF